MSDKPTNHELDDELLSAYLDGELSADERAGVEARLATNPAAQQLLHELRSVSQSVQALPTESLGRDLGEEIIRRAREAKPELVVRGSPDPAPSRDRRSPHSVDALPRIRIFNSKRAWIWASMALAAGLLIMFVQSGDEASKKLPPVAARNHEEAQIQPADEAGQPPRREISMSAEPKSPSPPTTTIADEGELHEKVDPLGAPMPAAPMASESRGVESRRSSGIAAGPPAAAASPAPQIRKEVAKTITQLDDAISTSTASPDQVATDKRVPGSEPIGSLSGASGAPGMSAGKQKSESIVSPPARQLFVVHVVATPDALKKGTFDRLLTSRKFEFEPQPAKDRSFSFGGGNPAKLAQSANEPKEQSNKAAEIDASKMEMVLVEAPASEIEACLDELNKNASDFVSISVNEERQPQDRVDTKSTMAKSLADSNNLSRFSRGAAPAAEKDAVDSRKYFYSYDFDKANGATINGQPLSGGFGGEAAKISDAPKDANGNETLTYKKQLAPEVRRARRIDTWGMDNPKAGEVDATAGRAPTALPLQSGAQAANRPMSQRTLNEQPEAKSNNQNNNLKVLFVFTPEKAPVLGAPSDKQPK